MIKNLPLVFGSIRAALMRRGRSAHDADDLVQEAWVRLACYERDQVVDAPEAFLMRTALNLSIDAHRMSVSHGEEVLVEEVVLIDTAPGTEAIVLARERMARLSLGIGRLNDKTRDIFLAHRVDGMTYQEIAGRHGLSTSTVEKYIAKAHAAAHELDGGLVAAHRPGASAGRDVERLAALVGGSARLPWLCRSITKNFVASHVLFRPHQTGLSTVCARLRCADRPEGLCRFVLDPR